MLKCLLAHLFKIKRSVIIYVHIFLVKVKVKVKCEISRLGTLYIANYPSFFVFVFFVVVNAHSTH